MHAANGTDGDSLMRVIGYLRVSTGRQEHGVDAQRAAITAEATRRGWEVEWVEDRGRSGKNVSRPGIQAALGLLKSGEAEALVVSKLDRLSRSLSDFAHLLETAKVQDWGIVALDLGVDTTTATGRLVASVMAAVASWEREVIGQRTKEGLAAAKAKGVRLAGPVLIPAEIEQRITEERVQGSTLAAIAGRLNDDQVPCAGRGKVWYPSTIRGVLERVMR